MANIAHLEMSTALMSLPEISVKKGLFGLTTKVTYTPTGSSVKVKINEYAPETGSKLEHILQADTEAVPELLANNKIEAASLGQVRLEACISDDKQFAAVQLLHFSQLNYTPQTDMIVFKGKAAEAIAALF